MTQMAVELGVEPIPVYHYGNSQLLFIIGKALEAVSRALRASLIVTYGRFGLPLPHRVPLMMVSTCAAGPATVHLHGWPAAGLWRCARARTDS